MKTCRQCGEEKALNEYYAHPKTKDQKQQACKTCSYKALELNKAKRRLESAFVRLHAQAERVLELQSRI